MTFLWISHCYNLVLFSQSGFISRCWQQKRFNAAGKGIEALVTRKHELMKASKLAWLETLARKNFLLKCQ